MVLYWLIYSRILHVSEFSYLTLKLHICCNYLDHKAYIHFHLVCTVCLPRYLSL